MNEASISKTLTGWGRMTPGASRVYRPEKIRPLADLLSNPDVPHVLARGLGRSYGDAAVNDGGAIIDMTRLNRMLAFDAATGTLECEAGVSLAEIIDVFLPRGYFLPVTPGTKYVTVGGAIANDIHGKNHHRDGTFSRFVEQLELLTPAGDRIICSPGQDAELFWATCGGLGLTGVILSARIRLHPVESAYMVVDYVKTRDLDEALATMAASDAKYKYSVGWVDCLAKGARLGRSVLMRGNHAGRGGLPAGLGERPFSPRRTRRKGVPVDLPGFVLNPFSIGAFNALFYGMHRSTEGIIVDYDKYFYPLDGILNWNRLYGKRGFAQYQATLPPESRSGLVKLLERLSASRRASFLAVLKCFGEAGPGPLSHPIKGYTLTLDLPNKPGLTEFLRDLDRILLDFGGRIYFAKDAVSLPDTVAKMYPRLEEFRAVQARVDPEGRLSSNMARRLGILGHD